MKLYFKCGNRFKSFLDGYFGVINNMLCYTCSRTDCYKSIMVRNEWHTRTLNETSTCNLWRCDY